MPTKPLSEETPGWLKELITDFDFNFLEDYDNGLITDVGLVDGLKKALAKAFKAGQTELAQKVLEEVIGEETDMLTILNDHVGLSERAATNELKRFQKKKLAQLVEKGGMK